MTAERNKTLIELLWPKGDDLAGPQVYALIDAARDPQIAGLVRFSRLEYDCLFAGRLSAKLQAAAPYIVHLAPKAQFVRTLLDVGWGRAWAVFMVTPPDVTLQQLRRHFRHVLLVRDEDGRRMLFRLYDPRVLRTYLPTCTTEDLRQVFGTVPRFLLESEEPDTVLSFRRGTTGLITTRHRIE